MTEYRIRFEISLTAERRSALVSAKTPGEAVQLVLADHGAICLLHLEELPPARGVAAWRGCGPSNVLPNGLLIEPVFHG